MISGGQWERGVSRRGCVIDLERFRVCTSRTRFPDSLGVEAAWLDHKVVKFRISSRLRFRERLRRECFFLSNAQGGVTRLDSWRWLDGRSFFFLVTGLLTAAPSRDLCALSEAAGRSNTEEHLFGSLARNRTLQEGPAVCQRDCLSCRPVPGGHSQCGPAHGAPVQVCKVRGHRGDQDRDGRGPACSTPELATRLPFKVQHQ